MTNDPETDDAALVRRACAGCQQSFRALVVRHERAVHGFLRRGLTQTCDVEDVAQETFVRAWRSLAGYRDEWRFATWLHTIAARARVDFLRRRGITSAQVVVGDLTQHEHAGEGPATSASRVEQAKCLWRLADRLLPAEQRMGLWLRYAEDSSVAEIARVLGRSSVAVRLLLLRARRRLAAHLRESPSGIELIDGLDCAARAAGSKGGMA